ncbi:armadillo repeat-containing protein 10-like [Chiloscyllium plagiosum]|uniref:armadillo repeat-containing protein 10-like n=1 Tax=Chiloscyllium plagiosum TaxID=36176 RepID=UPI001CB7B9E4|nr:armadillo repeat-containing protein 10-like [Chiloscyllium plagiosum]
MVELFDEACRKKLIGILTGAGAVYLLYRAIRSGLVTPQEDDEDLLIDKSGNSTLDSIGAVGHHLVSSNSASSNSVKMNLQDLKTVLTILHESKDPVIRGTILTSIYRIPGFSSSQELFRSEGGISIIAESLDDPLNYIKSSAVTVFNFLSNDPVNRDLLVKYIPQVLKLTTSIFQEFEQLPCLRFLTKMSHNHQNHLMLKHAIPDFFLLLQTGSSSIKFQVLQILINFSTNLELTFDMFNVQIEASFLFLFNYFQRQDILNDLLLLISNLNEIRRSLPYRSNNHIYCKDSLFVLLFGPNSQFSSRLIYLMASPDDRIKLQAARIVTNLG